MIRSKLHAVYSSQQSGKNAVRMLRVAVSSMQHAVRAVGRKQSAETGRTLPSFAVWGLSSRLHLAYQPGRDLGAVEQRTRCGAQAGVQRGSSFARRSKHLPAREWHRTQPSCDLEHPGRGAPRNDRSVAVAARYIWRVGQPPHHQDTPRNLGSDHAALYKHLWATRVGSAVHGETAVRRQL